ncbi:MAG: hypothetical protein ABMA64_41805 [Myxococcota bacterium]
MRMVVCAMGVAGCTGSGADPKGDDTGGWDGDCGDPIGTAATISTPILDPLVQLYADSVGRWEGVLDCETTSVDAVFTFEQVDPSAIVVTDGALTASEGFVCPAAKAEGVPVVVESDSWSFDGLGVLVLAVEGVEENLKIYARDGTDDASLHLTLAGAASARIGAGGVLCVGPMTR